jgi:hypothetical protein
MATHSNSPIISLLNEVIQRLHVRYYEIREDWTMVIPVKKCDYEHYINTYSIENDRINHTINLNLVNILKRREEGKTSD